MSSPDPGLYGPSSAAHSQPGEPPPAGPRPATAAELRNLAVATALVGTVLAVYIVPLDVFLFLRSGAIVVAVVLTGLIALVERRAKAWAEGAPLSVVRYRAAGRFGTVALAFLLAARTDLPWPVELGLALVPCLVAAALIWRTPVEAPGPLTGG